MPLKLLEYAEKLIGNAKIFICIGLNQFVEKDIGFLCFCVGFIFSYLNYVEWWFKLFRLWRHVNLSILFIQCFEFFGRRLSLCVWMMQTLYWSRSLKLWNLITWQQDAIWCCSVVVANHTLLGTSSCFWPVYISATLILIIQFLKGFTVLWCRYL